MANSVRLLLIDEIDEAFNFNSLDEGDVQVLDRMYW